MVTHTIPGTNITLYNREILDYKEKGILPVRCVDPKSSTKESKFQAKLPAPTNNTFEWAVMFPSIGIRSDLTRQPRAEKGDSRVNLDVIMEWPDPKLHFPAVPRPDKEWARSITLKESDALASELFSKTRHLTLAVAFLSWAWIGRLLQNILPRMPKIASLKVAIESPPMPRTPLDCIPVLGWPLTQRAGIRAGMSSTDKAETASCFLYAPAGCESLEDLIWTKEAASAMLERLGKKDKRKLPDVESWLEVPEHEDQGELMDLDM